MSNFSKAARCLLAIRYQKTPKLNYHLTFNNGFGPYLDTNVNEIEKRHASRRSHQSTHHRPTTEFFIPCRTQNGALRFADKSLNKKAIHICMENSILFADSSHLVAAMRGTNVESQHKDCVRGLGTDLFDMKS
ncbi:hypothetical protein TcasGA2_TC002796 [Tribolium castaneum]|uniref:Uncharacterized protein n=1 Tax=Tribolium castaneum TaxID=7070 RepID=D6WIM1_TRICA|nr:hypothetical protein TcasGA2_TC002796 [Tribolium castaneum]